MRKPIDQDSAEELTLKSPDLEEEIRAVLAIRRIEESREQAKDIPKMLNGILSAILEEVDVQSCSLMLVDQREAELALIAGKESAGEFTYHRAASRSPYRVQVGEGVIGKTAQNGKPIVIPDISKESIQIREYFSFPYLSLVQIDRVIFVGPYLYSLPCSEMPIFRIEDNGRESCVFRKYERHFDRLWDAARPITAGSVAALETRSHQES